MGWWVYILTIRFSVIKETCLPRVLWWVAKFCWFCKSHCYWQRRVLTSWIWGGKIFLHTPMGTHWIFGRVCVPPKACRSLNTPYIFLCIEQFSKPIWSLWPIEKASDNPMNQSKFVNELNTCSRWEAKGNVCEWIPLIGFGFTFGWKKKWQKFLLANFTVLLDMLLLPIENSHPMSIHNRGLSNIPSL